MFKTTPERRANLVKLARFLYTEPIDRRHFDMSIYSESDNDVACDNRECGTAGCAIGWAPVAGIAPLENEEWSDFSDRTLIIGWTDADAWSWCFCMDWLGTDNTPHGAAKRIIWLLLYGLPDDWESQMQGRITPLCYRNWTPTEADWQKASTT